MSGDFDSFQAMAQRAWDETCIKRTLAEVAHAQDNLDPIAYRKCFADKVLLSSAVMFPNWEPKEIPADELTRMTFESLGKADAGHHMVFNHLIDVSGDDATCSADLYAVSVLIEDGRTSSMSFGGRYFLRLRRQDGKWLIYERSIKERYRFGDLTLGARAAARAKARESGTPAG
jgi:hypothetical protein